jgi:hypothetical protein
MGFFRQEDDELQKAGAMTSNERMMAVKTAIGGFL